MKTSRQGKEKAITLMEFLMSIFLLGIVVLTGYTVELTMRRIVMRPKIESKLVDRLVPILELIKKDFEYFAIGIINDTGISNSSGANWKMLKIRVDSDFSGTISPGDLEHGYRWYSDNPNKYQFYYYPDASDSNQYEIIAKEVTDFGYIMAYDNTSLTLKLETKKDIESPYHPQTNPTVRLNTTIYTRKVSAM